MLLRFFLLDLSSLKRYNAFISRPFEPVLFGFMHFLIFIKGAWFNITISDFDYQESENKQDRMGQFDYTLHNSNSLIHMVVSSIFSI